MSQSVEPSVDIDTTNGESKSSSNDDDISTVVLKSDVRLAPEWLTKGMPPGLPPKQLLESGKGTEVADDTKDREAATDPIKFITTDDKTIIGSAVAETDNIIESDGRLLFHSEFIAPTSPDNEYQTLDTNNKRRRRYIGNSSTSRPLPPKRSTAPNDKSASTLLVDIWCSIEDLATEISTIKYMFIGALLGAIILAALYLFIWVSVKEHIVQRATRDSIYLRPILKKSVTFGDELSPDSATTSTV